MAGPPSSGTDAQLIDAQRQGDVQRYEEWLKTEVNEEKLWRRGHTYSNKLQFEFEEYLLDIFRATLRNAARTYRTITTMSIVMFLVGIGLFVFAVIYATTAEAKEYAVLFAGMGATTFVAIWVLEPFDRAQSALSNLMQAEVCFMSAFEEIKLWKGYASRVFSAPPGGGGENFRAEPAEGEAVARLTQASQEIDRATRRAMQMLERYVEPNSVRPRKLHGKSAPAAKEVTEQPSTSGAPATNGDQPQ